MIMKKFFLPPIYKHEHPPIRDVNEIYKEKLTIGQIFADRVAKIIGSWNFILIQSFLISIWIVLNFAAFIYHWDPYPFILLNLFLSLQAAYTAPIIMMSQNRLAEKDRIEAHNDYMVNTKSEEEIRVMLQHLDSQNEMLMEILKNLSNEKKN
jgi:uncharacterized membrane protein